MNGMRVPARFAILVVLGLSVLAGYGVTAILARVHPRRRRALAAVCLMAVLDDGWAAPLPLQAYDPKGRLEDRSAAQWLSAQPPGAVLHLPIRTNNLQELNYQYATLFHDHAIVNGYSGYNSRLQESLQAGDSPLISSERFPATIRALRSIGVRYVIVHRGDFSAPGLADWTIEQLRQSRQTSGEVALFGVSAFALAP
jgi:hypothetical protein